MLGEVQVIRAFIFDALGLCRQTKVAHPFLIMSGQPESDSGWVLADDLPGHAIHDTVPPLAELGPHTLDPDNRRITLG